MAAKKISNTLTLGDRFAIVQELKKGEKGKNLAVKYKVDTATITRLKKRQQEIEQEFEKQNIYNLDECGLFWRAFSNKSMAFKGETCSGGKRAKDRITVLVGANAAGEKMDLLVIGRSKTLRCFLGNTLPDIEEIDTEDCDIFDNNLATCESPFEHAILSDGQQQSMESGENCESEDCDGDSSNPIPVPSAKEALKTLDVLERYLSAYDDGFQQLRNLNKVGNFMMKTVNDNRKQAPITDYFY